MPDRPSPHEPIPQPPAPDGSAAPQPQESAPGSGSMPQTAAQLADETLPRAELRRLMGRLVSQTAEHARRAGWQQRPRVIMGAVTEVLAEVAGRLRLRDVNTLRAHHPGVSDDELASRLIRTAARATAAIGGAGGGIAAVEWAAPPTLLTAPVLLTAETIAVAAVELKLIGELHEVYGTPVRGPAVQRATALLTAWAQRRGVNPLSGARGMGSVLSTAARRELQDRLLRRFGRNLTTLAPLLVGAAVGAELNRRATRSVGNAVRDDLRSKALLKIQAQRS
ncbi:MAG: hypothetical protein ACRDT8_12810 [Micromonosporaceae bacterium]